jgi:hypothetical protein
MMLLEDIALSSALGVLMLMTACALEVMSGMLLSVTQFESVRVCDACAVSVINVSILEVHLSFIFIISSPAACAIFSLFTLPHRNAAVFR